MRTLKRADAPILQMRRGGTVVLGPAEAIERAHAEYVRLCCLRLPQLLEPELWQFLQRELAQARFEAQTYERIGSELCMVPGTVDFLLNLVSNDAGFLELIRQITGCDAIRSFLGRVYRLTPGEGHGTTWHNDLMTGTRLVAMSVNLSPEAYCGGTLQLRDPRSNRILQELANTGPGDAILFRIGSDLQHRVTPVNGTVPKSAYAGWFQSENVGRSTFGETANTAPEEEGRAAAGRP